MSGGQVAEVLASAGVLTVSGGAILGNVQVERLANMEISGGDFGGSLFALDSADVAIFGEGFNFPNGEIMDITGTITGTLADGTVLDLDFGRASTATIRLVPEPSTALLLASGLAALAVGRRRRGR